MNLRCEHWTIRNFHLWLLINSYSNQESEPTIRPVMNTNIHPRWPGQMCPQIFGQPWLLFHKDAAQDTNYFNRRLHIGTPGFLLRVKLALLVVLRNILCMNDPKQWKTCVITFSVSIIFLCLGTREWLLLILIDEADSWRWGRVSSSMSSLTRDTLFWTDGVNNKQPTTDSSSQKIFLRLIAINEHNKLHDRFKFAWNPFNETESVAKELDCADPEPQSQRASEVRTEWGEREGGEIGLRHPHPVIEAQGNPGIVELLHWLWREPSGYLNEVSTNFCIKPLFVHTFVSMQGFGQSDSYKPV